MADIRGYTIDQARSLAAAAERERNRLLVDQACLQRAAQHHDKRGFSQALKSFTKE